MSDEPDPDEPMTFEDASDVFAEIHQRRKNLWIAKYGEPTPRISFKVTMSPARGRADDQQEPHAGTSADHASEVSGSGRRLSQGAPDEEDGN